MTAEHISTFNVRNGSLPLLLKEINYSVQERYKSQGVKGSSAGGEKRGLQKSQNQEVQRAAAAAKQQSTGLAPQVMSASQPTATYSSTSG